MSEVSPWVQDNKSTPNREYGDPPFFCPYCDSQIEVLTRYYTYTGHGQLEFMIDTEEDNWDAWDTLDESDYEVHEEECPECGRSTDVNEVKEYSVTRSYEEEE
jgi:hypothetical protein